MVRRVIGVIIAATPHPNRLKMTLPANIIKRVTNPVAVEKFPMKAEYWLGSGNAAFNFDFHVT